MLTIRLSEDVERRLDELARTAGHSPSFHAERAIVEYLGDLEDYEAAEREVEEVQAGRSVAVPLGERATPAPVSRSGPTDGT